MLPSRLLRTPPRIATAAIANMARPKITLYVDTVSPFAYEAYHILRHDEVFKGCDITYVPIFLGGLMHKCGNTPPIRIKNKETWINRERLRWARHFSIPITVPLPPDFPAPSLPVMRALAAIGTAESESDNSNGQPRLIKALDALFSQHWEHAVATHKPEVLKESLAGLFGAEEAEKILTAASTTGKAALIQNTDAAFDSGGFGLPWMVCTNAEGQTEGFFGVDHLGQVAQFLGLGRGENKGGWRALL